MMAEAVHYPVGQIHWTWLTYRIADHLWIDAWRYAVIVGAFFAIGAAWFYYTRVEHKIRVHSIYVCTNTAVAIFIILQEAQQLGLPMLVWRLPYQTLIVCLIWWSVHESRRLRTEGARYVGA
jgi:hypothetical protein